MNYITLINSFWNLAMMNPLSTGQVSLYFALLHICNRSNWTEWFQAPNQVLSVLTGLSRTGILRARNELKQKGMIDFRERGTKATVYKIIAESKQVSAQDSKQVNTQEKDTIANSKQVGTQNSVQNSTQVSTQKGMQNSSTLYKQNKNETKQEIPPLSPVKRFEYFIVAYPKKCNRHLAEQEYVSLLSIGKVTEDELVQSAINYAEACRIEEKPERYIKNPANFLKEIVFEEYLPWKYKKPEVAKYKTEAAQKGFNNCSSRDYNFSALEKQLLGE